MTNTSLSRRTLFRRAAALAAASPLLAAGGKFTHPIGVELYTVRNVINKNPDEVLKRIAEIGYTEVEAGRDSLATIGPVLQKYKLKPTSVHLEAPLVTGDWTGDQKRLTMTEAIEAAKPYGVQYLVFPYLAPNKRGNADSYRKLADQFNEAGRLCHAAGLQFAYHNHAFEFEGQPGQRPLDILVERTDPKLVNFEVDVFWVSVAGNDPVEMLQKLKGRVPLIHLKDKKAGTPTMYKESVPRDTFQEVGSGSLHFAAILREAEKVGVKHYYVEQDQTPGDPVDSLAKSYHYLHDLSLKA